jgi:hypothetical protein
VEQRVEKFPGLLGWNSEISGAEALKVGDRYDEPSCGGLSGSASRNFLERSSIGSEMFRPAGNSLQWLNMKKIAHMALLVVLGSLYACSSSSNPAMSGSWLFSLTPIEVSAPVLQFTANLTQIGTQFTGQITLPASDASCGTAASITGTVMGNSLNFTLSQIDSSINFTGTANLAFTSASGTYTGASNSCLLNSGIGSWSAALQ